MSKLITSHYPPVNGNICEQFVAIDKDCMPCRFEWSDFSGKFIIEGTSIEVTYSELEKSYEVFVWQSEL